MNVWVIEKRAGKKRPWKPAITLQSFHIYHTKNEAMAALKKFKKLSYAEYRLSKYERKNG